MSEELISPIQAEAKRVFAAKKVRRQNQAQLPLKEKVRILLKMSRDDTPILFKRGGQKS